jgi:hypothetical protein
MRSIYIIYMTHIIVFKHVINIVSKRACHQYKWYDNFIFLDNAHKYAEWSGAGLKFLK